MPDPTSRPKPFVPVKTSGGRRLWKALKAKPDLGQVWVGLLVAAVGFAAVVHVRADEGEVLERARRADLVQIFQDLQRRNDLLESQINDLDTARTELLTAQDREQAALEAARTRQGQVAVLAGTVPVAGPGIVATITSPRRTPASTLISVVQALRESGAEAIEMAGGNGAAVRVGVNTYFLDVDGQPDAVLISGERVDLPFTITAIGDQRTLSAGITFGEGAADFDTIDEERDEVSIDSVREPARNEYARPAPQDE